MPVIVLLGFVVQTTENRCNQTTQGSPMVVACFSGTSKMMAHKFKGCLKTKILKSRCLVLKYYKSDKYFLEAKGVLSTKFF